MHGTARMHSRWLDRNGCIRSSKKVTCDSCPRRPSSTRSCAASRNGWCRRNWMDLHNAVREVVTGFANLLPNRWKRACELANADGGDFIQLFFQKKQFYNHIGLTKIFRLVPARPHRSIGSWNVVPSNTPRLRVRAVSRPVVTDELPTAQPVVRPSPARSVPFRRPLPTWSDWSASAATDRRPRARRRNRPRARE